MGLTLHAAEFWLLSKLRESPYKTASSREYDARQTRSDGSWL